VVDSLAVRLFVCVVFASVISICGVAQTHSGFPVDIVAGPPPQPVSSDGRSWLLYELHLTNYAPLPIELTSIEVLGAGGSTLASYRGEALGKLVIPVEKLSLPTEPPSSADQGQLIGEGHSVLVFFNLSLDSSPPAELRHRFTFSVTPKSGRLETTLEAGIVPVVQEPAPVLAPPLRGSSWVAFNALSSPDHRRSLNAVDGRERIPQRFAIDWMQIGPDRRLFHGDAKSNANYYGYGAEVLAVADGNVSDLKDGLPDNVGSNERSGRTITIDNAAGNYVIVDLGRGRFALYAHLQPGSLRVKVGDKVSAGQVLARLGNSGNSDAPHLHFQLMDSNSPLGSEGIAYELLSFAQLGVVEDEDAMLDHGQPWQPKSQVSPVLHRLEFPLNRAVVTFP